MFQISWSLDSAAWQRYREMARSHQPGSDFDLRGTAIFWSPSGPFQLEFHGQPLFRSTSEQAAIPFRYPPNAPLADVQDRFESIPQTYVFKIVDLAEAFVRLIDTGPWRSGPVGFQVRFGDGESENYFEFTKLYRIVRVTFRERWRYLLEHGSPSVFSDIDSPDVVPLLIPEEDFLAGVHAFLVELTTELHRRIPEFFEWKSFAPFLPYIDRNPT